MTANIILLSLFILASLWTVMTVRLLRAVIGLAITSVIVAVMMYQLNSPIAAVFELSVCAGLIFAIFITTISFTQRLTQEKLVERRIERISKFWLLPILVVLSGALMFVFFKPMDFNLLVQNNALDVKHVMWSIRHQDMLGQIIVLLAGAFGVVILFKEIKE